MCVRLCVCEREREEEREKERARERDRESERENGSERGKRFHGLQMKERRCDGTRLKTSVSRPLSVPVSVQMQEAQRDGTDSLEDVC